MDPSGRITWTTIGLAIALLAGGLPLAGASHGGDRCGDSASLSPPASVRCSLRLNSGFGEGRWAIHLQVQGDGIVAGTIDLPGVSSASDPSCGPSLSRCTVSTTFSWAGSAGVGCEADRFGTVGTVAANVAVDCYATPLH